MIWKLQKVASVSVKERVGGAGTVEEERQAGSHRPF